jgi:hypothetical protein
MRLRFRLAADDAAPTAMASGPPPRIAVHARTLRPLGRVTAEVAAGTGTPARLAMFVWP